MIGMQGSQAPLTSQSDVLLYMHKLLYVEVGKGGLHVNILQISP